MTGRKVTSTPAANPSRRRVATDFVAPEPWDTLPEDTSARYELMEGVMVVGARPALRHQEVVFEVCRQLRDQLPHHVIVAPERSIVEFGLEDGAYRLVAEYGETATLTFGAAISL